NPPLLFNAIDGKRLSDDEVKIATGLNPSALTAPQIIDSIRQFDPTKYLRLDRLEIYPAEYAFATGHLRGDLLGIRIANEAAFSAKMIPEPGSTHLGKIDIKADRHSFIGELFESEVDLQFLLSAPPANPIETVFNTVSNLLWEASNRLANAASPSPLPESALAAAGLPPEPQDPREY